MQDQQIEPSSWLSTKDTEIYLNVKRQVLYKQKNVDRLQADVHYRILDPEASRPTYEWNAKEIESCMENAIDELLVPAS